MNVASWLERVGSQSPCVAGGRSWHACRGDLRPTRRTRGAAGRRLARAVRLKPGERVAIVAKNSHHYLELLLRHLARRPRRGAGQRQAARRRARLHPRAFRRARLLRLQGPRRRHRAACAEKSRAPDHDRWRRLRGAVRRRSDRARAARAGRSRLAVLHLGHDRAAERRHAYARQSGGWRASPMAARSIRSRRATPSCTRRR